MEFSDVYDSLEFLGRGSFGDVKKCVHKQTQHVCAVKEVRYQREDSEEKKKIESEIQVRESAGHFPLFVLFVAVVASNVCATLSDFGCIC